MITVPRGIEGSRPRDFDGARDTGERFDGPPSVSEVTGIVVTLVIPARNEAKNLPWVLSRIPAFVDEVILVDGHSSDHTVAVARALRPDIVVISDGERGKGEAMRTGAAGARGTFVVMIDADGSMDPSEISRYVEALGRGYDFVKGSRFMGDGGTADMTPFRMVGHAVLRALTNFLYRTSWTDLCYGFCAFRRSALERIGLDADGFEIETQMVTRAATHRLRTTEVPSFEYVRRSGASQLNTFRDGFRVLRTIIIERLPRGDRSAAKGSEAALEVSPDR